MLGFPMGLMAQSSVHWEHELSNLPENFHLEAATVDNNDRLWLGNKNGLWIFDGIECRLFISLRIPSNITAIHVLSLDSIAIGTQDGTIHYIINKEIRNIYFEEEYAASRITKIRLKKDGSSWISTAGDGMYFWTGERMRNLNENDGLPSANISDFIVDRSNRLWLASDNGVVSFKYINDSIRELKVFGQSGGIKDPLATSICYDDKNDEIIVGTHQGGLFIFRQGAFNPLKGGENIAHVQKIHFVNGNKLLIQADSPTISILQLNENRLNDLRIPDKPILPALYSKEGFVWLFTDNRRVKQQSIYFIKFEAPQTPQTILSKDGKVWIGTEKGLYEGTLSNGQLHWREIEKFSGQNIISLEHMEQNLLIGTFGQGLFHYQPESDRSQQFTLEDGLPDQSLLDIFNDGEYIWLGTLGGLVRTKWDEQRISEIKSFVDTVYVYHIDSMNERIYFSTHGDGAGYINGKINWFQDAAVSSGEISTFGLLPGNQALFVTARQGLVYIKDQNVFKVSTPSNVSFETTSAIAADSISQRFFISHSNGLDIFDPEDSTVIHLGNNLKLNFSTSALNAHTYDGHLEKHFFGSAEGFFCIEPDLYTSRSSPNLEILSCQVNNVERSISELASLKSSERTLQLEVLLNWYTDPRAVVYRYKIDGLHPDWITTSDEKIIFPDLPYGSHTLNMQSGIYGYFNQKDEISIPIIIAHPLWMRWWFIILVFLLLAGGIYAFVKNRELKLQKWAKLEKETANAQIQALKSQVSPHFMFNSFNTLIALIEEAPEKAVKYAEDLSDFFRNLVSKRDQEMNTLRGEVEMADHYIELLKTRFGDNLDVHIDIDDWEGDILTYTLQILTENVVKHNVISSTQSLHFHIRRENDWLVVQNNLAPKYSVNDSTGFGLESIRERYRILFNKTIQIQKTDKTFTVKIPIIKNKKS